VKDQLSDPLPPSKKEKEKAGKASSPATKLRLCLNTREAPKTIMEMLRKTGVIEAS
jgi:hypothetical protein